MTKQVQLLQEALFEYFQGAAELRSEGFKAEQRGERWVVYSDRDKIRMGFGYTEEQAWLDITNVSLGRYTRPQYLVLSYALVGLERMEPEVLAEVEGNTQQQSIPRQSEWTYFSSNGNLVRQD